MTKQEYEVTKNSIKYDTQLGATNRLIEIAHLNNEYIASLEAENVKLEKLNSAALERLSKHACPPYLLNYGQPCNDSNECVACWRECRGGKNESR